MYKTICHAPRPKLFRVLSISLCPPFVCDYCPGAECFEDSSLLLNNNNTSIYIPTAITMITTTAIVVITNITEVAVMTIHKYIYMYFE